jgi:hypothetical protein
MPFARAVVTQGWLWAALLIIMLVFLEQDYPLDLRAKLAVIGAISLTVGLFIVGMLVFAMMTAPRVITNSIVPMP